MEKVWDIFYYSRKELIKPVKNLLGVSKSVARTKIENGWIKPSSTKAHFHFYISGYKYPILSIKSEELFNISGGFINKFVQDYTNVKKYFFGKYDKKRAEIMTGMAMKGLLGKPKMLNNAIYEIKSYLIIAKVDYIEAPRIADKAASEYFELLKNYNFRLGRGIFCDWGTIRLVLKWAERKDFFEYIKIRNSFTLEDWKI